MLCDWLAKFAPLSRPTRDKTKNNDALLARVFPRLAPVTDICYIESRENKKLCVCTASLELNFRLGEACS